jgi:hypothetical protein
MAARAQVKTVVLSSISCPHRIRKQAMIRHLCAPARLNPLPWSPWQRPPEPICPSRVSASGPGRKNVA